MSNNFNIDNNNISSLDDVDSCCSYIIIKHNPSDSTLEVDVDLGCSRFSYINDVVQNDQTLIGHDKINKPKCLIINNGTPNAFEYFKKYVNFYAVKKELNENYKEVPEPDAPLPSNVVLSNLFEKEAEVFGRYFNTTDEQVKKIKELKEWIEFANFMAANKLLYKIAAILAVLIKTYDYSIFHISDPERIPASQDDIKLNISAESEPEVSSESEPEVSSESVPDIETDDEKDIETDDEKDIETNDEKDIETNDEKDIETNDEKNIETNDEKNIETDDEKDIETDDEKDDY